MSISEERMKEIRKEAREFVREFHDTIDCNLGLSEYTSSIDVVDESHRITAARLGYSIEAYIKQKNIKRFPNTRLAEMVHCSRQAISFITTGRTAPSIELAGLIANVLGVREEFLLGTGTIMTAKEFEDIVEKNIQSRIEEAEKDMSDRLHERLERVVTSEIEQVFPLNTEDPFVTDSKITASRMRWDKTITEVEINTDKGSITVSSSDYLNLIDNIVEFAMFSINQFAKKQLLDPIFK